MQRLDIPAFRDALADDPAVSMDIVPRELRLEPGTTGVFSPAPQVLVGADQTHRGYALTWFGLAVALVIGYLVFWRRHRAESLMNKASTDQRLSAAPKVNSEQ